MKKIKDILGLEFENIELSKLEVIIESGQNALKEIYELGKNLNESNSLNGLQNDIYGLATHCVLVDSISKGKGIPSKNYVDRAIEEMLEDMITQTLENYKPEPVLIYVKGSDTESNNKFDKIMIVSSEDYEVLSETDEHEELEFLGKTEEELAFHLDVLRKSDEVLVLLENELPTLLEDNVSQSVDYLKLNNMLKVMKKHNELVESVEMENEVYFLAIDCHDLSMSMIEMANEARKHLGKHLSNQSHVDLVVNSIVKEWNKEEEKNLIVKLEINPQVENSFEMTGMGGVAVSVNNLDTVKELSQEIVKSISNVLSACE